MRSCQDSKGDCMFTVRALFQLSSFRHACILQAGTTASPQAACMPVGRSIVPDSSEAHGTSREAPSDVQQCRMGAGCGRRELFWAGLRLRAAGKVSRTLKLPLARCSFNAAWKELSGAMRATSGDQRVGAQRPRGAIGPDGVAQGDSGTTRVNVKEI